MKITRIPTNGIELYVEEHSTAGEAMVLLAYQGGQTVIWQDVIPHFTDRYRVIALDLRGHGHSDLPPDGYDMDTMAEDVGGVLDALGIERAHFLGNSLGAYVATCFAAKYPARALSLSNAEGALHNTAGAGGRFEHLTLAETLEWVRTRTLPEFASREAFLQWMEENDLPWNDLRARSAQATVLRELEDGRVTLKQTLTSRLSIMEDLYNLDLADWYRHIQCPVLFLPCEREEGLEHKLEQIRRFQSTLPFSKTVVIPNTEHLMTFDHSNELALEVLEFLEQTR